MCIGNRIAAQLANTTITEIKKKSGAKIVIFIEYPRTKYVDILESTEFLSLKVDYVGNL